MVADWPEWIYFPNSTAPPGQVAELVTVVGDARPDIDSASHKGLSSDQVLAKLRTGLLDHGFSVESSKKQADKVVRPVLFGQFGSPRVTYEVDAWSEDQGVLLEIEAGRGAMSNAV
ncbi:MAG: hypothetical protein M0005_03055 [Actinomycetota bacterium]|jgi:hypothetical protein|nr:hypothetical protein [Actinomycetota bacterium]